MLRHPKPIHCPRTHPIPPSLSPSPLHNHHHFLHLHPVPTIALQSPSHPHHRHYSSYPQPSQPPLFPTSSHHHHSSIPILTISVSIPTPSYHHCHHPHPSQPSLFSHTIPIIVTISTHPNHYCSPTPSPSLSSSPPIPTIIVPIPIPSRHQYHHFTQSRHHSPRLHSIPPSFSPSLLHRTDVAQRRSSGQPNFARCLAVSWAGWYIYIHFRGFLSYNGILAGAKFSLRPSFAFSYIAALLHSTRAVSISQTLRRSAEGASAPSIFGRAAITLGIGPHSSIFCF